METREKIIVMAAITAIIIYGIYFFLPDSSSDKKPVIIENKSENTTDDVYMIIDMINKKLSALTISNPELFIISQSNSDWNDSFIIKKENIDKQKIIDISLPKYSGYLSMGNKKFAVLNGSEYQAGENLESSSYVIEKIYPDKVVIRKNNENEIIVPIEKSDKGSYVIEKMFQGTVVIRKNNENEIIVPIEDSD
ncbi:Uncharacterized protein dnl_15840 [Desulfonema limicola]|uniref:Uncharacterized protein n=1 Tax=Desulfonema limicola TaxID=45656 RepID=A0A975B5T5_9BACT|nr:hypothetical protein [Desulfonema limicola]QTA79322.1 Uncharacterized protein dnl_15840 [Desulfonema limicola]